MENFSFGAIESNKDTRTLQHEKLVQSGIPKIKGGIVYDPTDILYQAKVGICTAISLIQNRQKVTGRKYSPEFQYLLQKKFYDLNWMEGSSILNALKVGKKYGFLPASFWTYTTDEDRQLPYEQYIQKLQAIPDNEIQRLIGLCIDKIPGYAFVNPNDVNAISHAIEDSEAGVLCMYLVSRNWFTKGTGEASWKPEDIDPLRPPDNI